MASIVQQGITPEISLRVKSGQATLLQDQDGQPSRSTAGVVQDGYDMVTTGEFVKDIDDVSKNLIILVKVRHTEPGGWLKKAQISYIWAKHTEVEPSQLGYSTWLDKALAAPLSTPPDLPTDPDVAEKKRLAAEFVAQYPNLPQPVEIYKVGSEWYYRFKTGQTARVADFADLTASKQRALAGGTDTGLGFSLTGNLTDTNGGTPGKKSTNWLLIGGIAVATLALGAVAWFTTRKTRK